MSKLINNKKIIVIASIVILLASFGIGKYYLSIDKTLGNTLESDKNIMTVQTKKISPEPLKQHISTSTVIKSSSEANVSSKMTGNVASIYFNEGEWVNVGQTIMRLEQDETLLTAYNNAKNNLNNVLASTKKDKKVAKVAIKTSDGDAKKQAEANLSSVKKKIELQIGLAQGQIDSAQAQLNNTIIKAPISGVISQIYLDIGEMIVAGSPAVHISNPKDIEISLALTEFDVGRIKVGQEVEINLAPYPDEKFMGKVYYVSSVASPVSKKFPVKAKLENLEDKIKGGMIAKINITTDKQENVLIIPKTAVFTDDNIEKVYLVDNSSRIKIAAVKTESVNDKLKVLEGLSGNENIVINGNYDLIEGEEIIIKN